MGEPLRDYNRQLVMARDVSGNPFAFVPLLSRLYRLEHHDISIAELTERSLFVTDVSAVPTIEEEFNRELDISGIESLQRKHTPGVALVVTQNCNLGCSYCLAKQGTFGLPITNMKSGQVLRRLESLFEMEPNIDFIKFFGGEPTLRMDLIEEVCDFVTNKLGKRVHFALTTNGTLKASKHIELWKRYHVSVSVSVDGPPHIHDAVRIRKDGSGSHEQALEYCDYLRQKDFPFAVVGVFDERHITSGFTYLDTIKYLNKISPLVKVQFVEALGDAVNNGGIGTYTISDVKKQVESAVDAIMELISNTFVDWSLGSDKWLYDNNILRFVHGIVKEKARPYSHACTASQLTTVFPSGDLTACYTFSERSDLRYGDESTSKISLSEKKQQFRDHHNWKTLSNSGVSVPWYRGVVGDICVADMMNSPYEGLRQSDFYKAFQETAVLRILQHLPMFAKHPLKQARLLHAIEKHRTLTGEYSRKP
ncbi:GTP 3',8-cyclase [Bacillus subtilis]|uniref:radical SAM protein n=1 Tax=Bacillus subtilis TaxID=1423 RepID=UPI001C23AB5A|nr:radical SAM protein [Bacillus subtilis]MBU8678747.1 radical SAM protein [Bacillus subtilis]